MVTAGFRALWIIKKGYFSPWTYAWISSGEKLKKKLEVSDLRLLEFFSLKTYLTLWQHVSKLDLGNAAPKSSNYGSYVYSVVH